MPGIPVGWRVVCRTLPEAGSISRTEFAGAIAGEDTVADGVLGGSVVAWLCRDRAMPRATATTTTTAAPAPAISPGRRGLGDGRAGARWAAPRSMLHVPPPPCPR